MINITVPKMLIIYCFDSHDKNLIIRLNYISFEKGCNEKVMCESANRRRITSSNDANNVRFR